MYHDEFARLLEDGWELNNFLQGVRLSSKQGSMAELELLQWRHARKAGGLLQCFIMR